MCIYLVYYVLYRLVQDINVVGAFRVIHYVARSMKKTGGGVREFHEPGF